MHNKLTSFYLSSYRILVIYIVMNLWHNIGKLRAQEKPNDLW